MSDYTVMQDYVLTNAKICTSEQVIEGSVAVENGKISAIGDIEKSYQHLPHFHCQSSEADSYNKCITFTKS